MLYAFGKAVTYWYVRLFYRMRYEGLEHVPADRGFILASNHRGYTDPIFIASKVTKIVHYMAKAELFRKVPLFGWLIRHLNAFPVERGAGDGSAMNAAGEVIRNGEVLGIFPEGTRSRDGKPLRPRSGVAMIAAKTGADVVPVAICYGERLRFRTPVTVRYGRPISFAELEVDAEKPSTIRAGARKVMDAIETLLEQGVG